MGGKQVLTLWDYDGESTKVTIPTVAIDELNLVAQDAFMDTFLTAIAGVTLGIVYKDVRTFADDQLAGAAPIDKEAQREKKWLVRMHDAVTWAKHTMEIGTADLSLLDDQNRGQMDQSLPSWTLLKSAIENFYTTPAGNAVVVDEAVFVGRNL